jgi:hypothetical protein
MGALIGELIVDVVSGIKNASRESLAAAMRAAADKVERGDLVADEALERANKDQSKLDAIRSRFGK